MAAWVLWFALFMGGIWLAEWCWKPYRETQERLRHEQTETLRAIERERQGEGLNMIAAIYARKSTNQNAPAWG